ncbi:MAG TPA: EthD family reductase [Chloroflexota bacterium]|nr:EthD family reductase [Chloroflexota bacterium]
MVRLTILYGRPADPEAFDRYYRDIHIPLARKMRGWTRWTLEWVIAEPDQPPPPYHLVVGLYAASVEDAQRALASPESQAASADVPKFATGGATFLLTEVEDVAFE